MMQHSNESYRLRGCKQQGFNKKFTTKNQIGGMTK